MEEINALLEKYNHFKYEQIRSVKWITDTSILLTLVIQDDEGEDVESIEIEFSDIKESRLLENSVLPLMDMTSGITIIEEHGLYGFALGSGSAMLHVHNAPLYIVASGIKLKEQ